MPHLLTTWTPQPSLAVSGEVWAWGAAVVFAGIAAVLVRRVRRTERSLRDIRAGAGRLAKGDLSHRVSVEGSGVARALALTLNGMAVQLDQRLSAVVQQRNELDAVLASMVEGVIAVDTDDRLISSNVAASQLLQLDPMDSIGRPMQEIVRNASLLAFVEQALKTNASVHDEIMVRVEDADGVTQDRHVQMQGALLCDADGERIGAVIVLHDVTQLRRLEAVRRDFVANVSHEVKTPISAIKAAIETLLDESGMPGDPDAAERFMQIIRRQADRLEAIVEDLLSLARIEEDERDGTLEQLAIGPVGAVVQAARETCTAKAEKKQIVLAIDCPQGLETAINPALLEQALVNLIDNAIKYSPEGTRVLVTARRSEDEIVVSVTDEGRGIEPMHLPRVFERFYRTDRARSRALGGTGLGLAIVKHVAEAHGGRASVESYPGRGSTFRIHLPISTLTPSRA